ncbi:cupin domain-containing protein [Thioalkalivibrio sp. ALJ16]|uniref:cupin domain-containing protein n=1 Tax=Thioalkalivibrio sp. ALJ16 TaxID=1158762 RepID=UPI00036CCF9B|nr:cupin domain-containing protein [Thioalkalivibrio sp. ALJ16]
MHTHYAEIPAYDTKDGSEIRELMHPDTHGNAAQSLAEAVVQPGATTLLHRHARTEELYHITRGAGEMRLGAKTFAVAAGDTVCIAPGTPHNIRNTGTGPLHILCSCSPPYSHDDTELL